jgi:hypothetical protein
MKTFLLAGLLYLSGIAIVLLTKPSVMFKKDGTWKEFGIGRNEETHTWCPFWLFCIFWALVSYIISIFIIRIFSKFIQWSEPIETEGVLNYEMTPAVEPKRLRRGSTLPQGYYVLAKPVKPGESPSYVYLGPEA